jgi:hypothetical protein
MGKRQCLLSVTLLGRCAFYAKARGPVNDWLAFPLIRSVAPTQKPLVKPLDAYFTTIGLRCVETTAQRSPTLLNTDVAR